MSHCYLRIAAADTCQKKKSALTRLQNKRLETQAILATRSTQPVHGIGQVVVPKAVSNPDAALNYMSFRDHCVATPYSLCRLPFTYIAPEPDEKLYVQVPDWRLNRWARF